MLNKKELTKNENVVINPKTLVKLLIKIIDNIKIEEDDIISKINKEMKESNFKIS
jgi:hypothetical protein